LALEAVQDAFCVHKWVLKNDKEYNIETNRLVLMGPLGRAFGPQYRDDP
jgi:acetyl esterase/lipase